ncbi:hypothetical protein, partial [Streptomyces sp. NPDC002692]
MSSQRSSAPDDKDRQVVVSVRFPNHLLERIQAMAVVLSSTANAVIRDGMEAYVRERGFPNGETRQSSWAVTHT